MYGTPGIVTCRDTYTYLSCPGSSFTQFLVVNQPVAVGFGIMHGSLGPEAATYDVYDQILLPGSNPIPQYCDAIRFKNATPGVIGAVQINARSQRELPHDATLQTSYVPSYQVLNPDGTISAIFSGHIRALGVDIPTSPTDLNVSGDNRVNWIQDGATIYDGIIYTSKIAANDRRMQLGTFPFQRPSPVAGTPTSGFDIIDWQSRGVAGNKITVFTRNHFYDLLLDDDTSDVLRMAPTAAPTNLKIQFTSQFFAVPAGASTVVMNINPYALQHVYFHAMVMTAAGASTTVFRAYPTSTTQGAVDLNSTILQGVTMQAISIGI